MHHKIFSILYLIILLFTISDISSPPILSYSAYPRLYFNEEELNHLQSLKMQPDHQVIWDRLQSWADTHIADLPPTGGSWDLVWSSKRYLENMGLVYAVTGNSIYAEATKRWAISIADLPDWGNYATTSLVGANLAFAYDVLRNYLTPSEQSLMRVSIRARMNYVYQYYNADVVDPSLRAYPNIANIFAGGLGLCGLALEGESDVPEAASWIVYAQKLVSFALNLGGSDGGWFEGPNYATDWSWSVKFLDALNRVKGINLFNNEFLKQLPYYFIYFTYNNRFLPVEDTYWNYSNTHSTAFLYRLASEYDDGYVQWIAAQSDPVDVNYFDASFFDTFLFKKDILPVSPVNLPLSKYFNSIGYVISRSGWDNDDLVFYFKSGSSVGHAHNSQNEFGLFYQGQVLTSGPGNVTGSEADATWSNNCLLVDGVGQGQEPGDNSSLPFGVVGTIRDVRFSPYYDYVRGDASAVYAGALDSWLRSAIFIKSASYLVVYDDVSASTEKQFDITIQAPNLDGYAADITVSADNITLSDGNLKLVASVIKPESANYSIVTYTGPRGKASYFELHPSQKVSHTQFLTVYFPLQNNELKLETENVSIGNLIGVKVISENNVDLILFSSDDQPVDQFVELGGNYMPADNNSYLFESTGIRVQFEGYQVIKLKPVN